MTDFRDLVEADRESREDTVGWLLTLDDETFRHCVADDVRCQLDEEASAALRDPRVTRRWFYAVKSIQSDIETQFAERKADRSPEAEEWRRKAARFREGVRHRRNEARVIMGDRAVSNAQSLDEKRRRGLAGEAAIHRLIGVHQEEFNRLLAEELAVQPPEVT